MIKQNTPLTKHASLDSYSRIIVAFSGGKDSLACVLHLLEADLPKERIELWHHDVDGREGSDLMDWPCTRSYCKSVANALGLPIYFSWKQGGFEREMLRDHSRTAPTMFEEPVNGQVRLRQVGGENGKLGTRWKFPQVSADLRVRWCSAYLKIDVASAALRNQKRFDNSRTLFVTGERAEESPGRARYAEFETHRSDGRHGRKARHVDHWRPVKDWPESQVWEIIERWKINPHPAYKLGFGRVSCAGCIFGSPNQWASLRTVNPSQFTNIACYEALFGLTIHRTQDVEQRAAKGNAYEAITPELISEAKSKVWNYPVFIKDWALPAGAFGESAGPV